MNCQQCRRQAGEYFRQRLTPTEKLIFQQHLDLCPDCQKFLATEKMVDSLLDAWVVPAPVEDLSSRIKIYVRQRAQSRPNIFARLAEAAAAHRGWAWTGMAACLVLLAVLIVTWFKGLNTANEVALAQNLEILRDYEVVTNYDLLENWERFQAWQKTKNHPS